MINQQLLDFIKSQLSKGVDKETITKELFGGGWVQQDIQEGFSAINASVVSPEINQINNSTFFSDINNPIIAQNHTFTGRKVLFIVVILFILAGGASGYYFRNNIPIIKDLVKNKEVVLVNGVANEENIEKQNTEVSDYSDLSNKQKNSVSGNEWIVTEKIVEGEAKDDNGILDYNIKVTTDITTMVDCGDENCFANKFALCQPAKITFDTDGLGAASYQIIKQKDGGCSMIFKYIQNPNPEWVNKEMTCTFDNKITLEKSIEKVFNGIFNGSVICTGPLYTTLRSMMN